MMYQTPMCLNCKNFKGAPTKPGGKAKCSKKPNGISERVYWEGAKCSLYTPKKAK